MGSVGSTGEFALIDALTARFRQGAAILLGPGDDAAVVAAPDGRTVVSCDLLVEGVHFRRDWSSAYDVGRKAAAQNLADIAAMGAAPAALVVGLAVPPELPEQWVLDLADGLRDEAERTGASVAGGDIARSAAILVAVTALGSLHGRAPLCRSGARAGDVVAVAGRLGWSAAGLAVLRRGFRSPRVLVEAHRRPEPPYDAGVQAAQLGATALVDVSDGLVQDLGHVARASRVRIDLDASALEVPAAMRDTAAALGTDPLEWLLTGGEDHAMAATFPAGVALPDAWTRVGRVLAAHGNDDDPLASAVVTVDGQPWPGSGYDHFPGGGPSG